VSGGRLVLDTVELPLLAKVSVSAQGSLFDERAAVRPLWSHAGDVDGGGG